jgi:hypothetical protein
VGREDITEVTYLHEELYKHIQNKYRDAVEILIRSVHVQTTFMRIRKALRQLIIIIIIIIITIIIINYWLKEFPATHSYTTETFNILIEEPKKIPEWLTTGITYLLPKSEDTKEPNYRPITCLSTMYKTLTEVIARRISSHLEEHNFLPAEQKEITLEVEDARINC